MGTAKKKGLKVKGLDSVWVMTFDADVNGEVMVNIIWITRLGMEASRTVAHLATGIFQRRGLDFRYKPPGLSITCCMAFKAFCVFGRGELLLHPFDALK